MYYEEENMSEIKLKVLNKDGHTLSSSDYGKNVFLVHTASYEEGDHICLETDAPEVFCKIQLEDSMPQTLILLKDSSTKFEIPFGSKKLCYSPKSFTGTRHLITGEIAEPSQISARRNLAFNPYDRPENNNVFPHASANIETRGESVFMARNTIDGVFANSSHGEYPYHSWGINKRADAELKVEFGAVVELDEIRLTLRADFPHDNYWTQATLFFSEGEPETIKLAKTHLPQSFSINRRTEWVKLSQLIQSSEPSPFPALTQFEAFGII